MRRRAAEDDDLCVNVVTAVLSCLIMAPVLFFMMYVMDYMKNIGLDLHSPFMGGGHEL
jgi:hypothetical protein